MGDSPRVQSYKVVLLGEAAVGKSSIVQRFVNGTFTNQHQPTIGALFQTKILTHNNRIIKFEIWDTAGQERFHSLASLYYKNAKGAIVVFDVTSSSSFTRAQKWVNELIEKASPGIIICLCGNKIDLENRCVTNEEASKYSEEIGAFYCEVSAKLNNGIEAMFKNIVDKLPDYDKEDEGMKLNEDKNTTSNTNSKCCYYY